MILQQVRLAVVEGQEAAFEAALCEVRQRVFMTAGFRGFAGAQGVDRPSTYLVQVRWETFDEVADAAGSGRLERCWSPVRPFLVHDPVVDHYEERPGLAFSGPGVVTDLAWLSGDLDHTHR